MSDIAKCSSAMARHFPPLLESLMNALLGSLQKMVKVKFK